MTATFEDVRNDAGDLIGFRFNEPDPPRFRYFQKKNGPMFSWTTEKVEDRYASFVHVPVSDVEWQLDDDSISAHKLRKDAKARALRLYRAWLDGEAKPW